MAVRGHTEGTPTTKGQKRWGGLVEIVSTWSLCVHAELVSTWNLCVHTELLCPHGACVTSWRLCPHGACVSMQMQLSLVVKSGGCSLVVESGGCSLVVVHRFLIVLTSLVVEHML